jgi:hypothetical protein
VVANYSTKAVVTMHLAQRCRRLRGVPAQHRGPPQRVTPAALINCRGVAVVQSPEGPAAGARERAVTLNEVARHVGGAAAPESAAAVRLECVVRAR